MLSEQWIVSNRNGSYDSINCGTINLPCRTIAYALEKRANDNDTLLIDGGPDSYAYMLNNTLNINKNITLTALHNDQINNYPVFSLDNPPGSAVMEINAIHVVVSYIRFNQHTTQTLKMFFINSSSHIILTVSNCIFDETTGSFISYTSPGVGHATIFFEQNEMREIMCYGTMLQEKPYELSLEVALRGGTITDSNIHIFNCFGLYQLLTMSNTVVTDSNVITVNANDFTIESSQFSRSSIQIIDNVGIITTLRNNSLDQSQLYLQSSNASVIGGMFTNNSNIRLFGGAVLYFTKTVFDAEFTPIRFNIASSLCSSITFNQTNIQFQSTYQTLSIENYCLGSSGFIKFDNEQINIYDSNKQLPQMEFIFNCPSNHPAKLYPI